MFRFICLALGDIPLHSQNISNTSFKNANFQRLLATVHIFFTSPSSSSSPDSVEDELELSAVRHRPEGLEQLEAQTRFSRKELQILYRGFKNVSDKATMQPQHHI